MSVRNYYETHAQDTVSKEVTTIRVNIAPEARKRMEELDGEQAEAMIQRCVWRFIGLKHGEDAIKGKVVEFSIAPKEIMKLRSDLQAIDLKEKQASELKS